MKIFSFIFFFNAISFISFSQPNNLLYDTRDASDYGHPYKVAKIGTQWWMAENLNFKTPNGSFCPQDKEFYCFYNGRVYSWEAAKIACPMGKRLPID